MQKINAPTAVCGELLYVIITITERALRATHFGLSLSDSARHRSKRSINLRGNAEKSTNSPCWLFRLGGKCQPRMNQRPLSCANCLDLQPHTKTLSQHEEMNVSEYKAN